MKVIIGYLIGVVAFVGLWYILGRVQMRAWLDEINKHFKNFKPNFYERKEE